MTFGTEIIFFGIDILPPVIALVLAFVGSIIFSIAYKRVRKILEMVDKKTEKVSLIYIRNAVDAINKRIVHLLIFAAAFKIATPFIPDILSVVITVLIAFLAGSAFVSFLESVLDAWVESNAQSQSIRSMKFVAFTVAKAVVWIIIFTLTLANLGIDVTALIAGIGISGIAVGLATQKVLADVFSSFVIFLDKNILVGDWVETSSFSGTVEKIGIKTTHIRALSGEEIIVPNDAITSQVIRNTRSRKQRRVAFDININENTKTVSLEIIPSMVQDLANEFDTLEFNRCYLSDFGAGYYVFSVVLLEKSGDFKGYAQTVNDFNIALIKELKKKKIDIVNPRYVNV